MFEMKLEGLEEIQRRMQYLATNMPEKAAASASRKAFNVMRDAARQNAKRIDDPDTAEAIYKNIAVTRRRKSEKALGPGNIFHSLGVMGGAVNKGNSPEEREKISNLSGGESWYWRLLEFGTEHMAARPILTPAINATAEAVVSAFTSQLSKEVDRLIEKGRT